MFDRVRDIIHVTLAERGITRYRLIDITPENWPLPGSSYYTEIEAVSGIVVTPERAYHFDLGWVDDHYTLGEEGRGWHELTPEDTTEYNWQKILKYRQQMQNDPAFGWREPLGPPMRETSKPTEREVTIIWWWLASSRFFSSCDLTDYAGPILEAFEVFEVQSGGHDLVGSLLPGEVQDISGILVLAQGAFHFRLSWELADDPRHRNPKYSQGEENGSWRPVLREECSQEQWQQLQMTQRRLEQVFVQLPRSEQPERRDRVEDNVPSAESLPCLRRNRVKRTRHVIHIKNSETVNFDYGR